MNKKFAAYVDGGCPNNGKKAKTMYGSYVVYDITDMETHPSDPEIHSELLNAAPVFENLKFDLMARMYGDNHAGYAVKKVTNNTAEAMSLLLLLTDLNAKQMLVPNTEIHIFMDSDLIMHQVTGIYKIKQQHLKNIHNNIRKILQQAHTRYGERVSELINFIKISGDTMKASRIAH
jgi:ribonuclease HI